MISRRTKPTTISFLAYPMLGERIVSVRVCSVWLCHTITPPKNILRYSFVMRGRETIQQPLLKSVIVKWDRDFLRYPYEKYIELWALFFENSDSLTPCSSPTTPHGDDSSNFRHQNEHHVDCCRQSDIDCNTCCWAKRKKETGVSITWIWQHIQWWKLHWLAAQVVRRASWLSKVVIKRYVHSLSYSQSWQLL